jgi:DNA-binding NarL/FixJ family response regulator
VVVDDHRFMRELIIARLSREPDTYEVVGEAEDIASTMSVVKTARPDVLILDVNLPDKSGIDAVPQLRDASPGTRILLCTAYVSAECAAKARKSGAHGFVEKTNTWDDFIEAVHRVGRGEQYFVSRDSGDPETFEKRTSAAERLTEREREILKLIADSGSSKEIASRLGISVATVEKHRTNLMAKLGVRNVAGLVSFAFHTGVLEVDPARH